MVEESCGRNIVYGDTATSICNEPGNATKWRGLEGEGGERLKVPQLVPHLCQCRLTRQSNLSKHTQDKSPLVCVWGGGGGEGKFY